MAEPTDWQPQPFADRYEIRQQLWFDGPHGGWLAFDRMVRREVILNTPYRPEDSERFVFGAQLRARFRHAHLIPLYEFNFSSNGTPYFTDPYLVTLSLGQYSPAAPDVTLAKQIRFLLDICAALSFLHASNLLHLNLTPESVLITQPFEETFLIRGHPSLPAAEMTSENRGLTSDGIVGTPAYMAPERVNPERFGPTTFQTDVYGLGGLLYFVLYGDAPNFCPSGRSRSMWSVIESLADRKGPPMPGRLRFTRNPSQELAKRLEGVCLRALHCDLAKRQKDAAEFSKDLLNALRI